MRRASFFAAWLALASVGVGVGCLVDLNHTLSCGDGYIDLLADEECEPGVPSSYIDACRDLGRSDADATCDPETCQVLDSEAACAVCGDQEAQGSEVCDGPDLKGNMCPSGSGQLRCSDTCDAFDLSQCDDCGDGNVDEGEECDFRSFCESNDDCSDGQSCDLDTNLCHIGGGVAPLIACSNLDSMASGLGDKPYAHGAVLPTDCTEQCVYDRSDCTFCGDGVRDGTYTDIGPSGDPVPRPAEACDGDAVPSGAIQDFCLPLCSQVDTSLVFGCAAECADDCTGLTLPEDIPDDPDPAEDLMCCIAGGSSCANDPPYPCCWALEHEGQGDGCDPVFDPDTMDVVDQRCRSL